MRRCEFLFFRPVEQGRQVGGGRIDQRIGADPDQAKPGDPLGLSGEQHSGRGKQRTVIWVESISCREQVRNRKSAVLSFMVTAAAASPASRRRAETCAYSGDKVWARTSGSV